MSALRRRPSESERPTPQPDRSRATRLSNQIHQSRRRCCRCRSCRRSRSCRSCRRSRSQLHHLPGVRLLDRRPTGCRLCSASPRTPCRSCRRRHHHGHHSIHFCPWLMPRGAVRGAPRKDEHPLLSRQCPTVCAARRHPHARARPAQRPRLGRSPGLTGGGDRCQRGAADAAAAEDVAGYPLALHGHGIAGQSHAGGCHGVGARAGGCTRGAAVAADRRCAASESDRRPDRNVRRRIR